MMSSDIKEAPVKEKTTNGQAIHILIPKGMFKKIAKDAKRRCVSKATIVRECLEKIYA